MREFAAFISYSHADTRDARWLHHRLETYRLPRALAGTPSPFGPVPRRLPPIFRDRDELPASGDLGSELRAALAAARFLVVICSPKAAQSHWVNEEVLSFKRLHGEDRVLALIVAGEPYDPARECFPPALRFRLGPDGALSDVPAEPIAADVRPGKDGRRLALLKLVAGIAGVPLDALVRRDAARRQRRLLWITVGSLAIAVLTIGLAIYAESQRRVAERQRLLADRSLDFLIGTFNIANPATENPRTITALTILQRASRSAARDLADEPGVSARLLRATGEIYYNLGLPQEAERDLRAALARLPARGEEPALTELKLAQLAYVRGDASGIARAVDAASAAVESGAAYAPSVEAALAEARGWESVTEGDYAAAQQHFSQAAAGYRTLPGDQREDLGRVLINEAAAYGRMRQFAKADRLFEQAANLLIARFGRNHLRTATAIQNRAYADFELGRIAVAEGRMGEALGIYARVLEPDHPTMAAALLLNGRIRTAAREIPAALADLDRAAGIYGRLYGSRAPAVADANFYAAEAESVAGLHKDALRRLALVKSIYDEAYGQDDPDQIELLLLRARILAAAGQHGEAQLTCRSALTLQRKLDAAREALGAVRDRCALLEVR